MGHSYSAADDKFAKKCLSNNGQYDVLEKCESAGNRVPQACRKTLTKEKRDVKSTRPASSAPSMKGKNQPTDLAIAFPMAKAKHTQTSTLHLTVRSRERVKPRGN